MKILLDKPAPTPTTTNKSTQTAENMLDLLTEGLFSNTLNNMQEPQETVVDSESDPLPEINEENMQQDLDAMMAELLQQIVISEPVVRQKEPAPVDSAGFDFAANVVKDNVTHVVEAEGNAAFKPANTAVSVDENAVLINQLPREANLDDTYSEDARKDQNEKSDNREVDTYKNLTASVKLSEATQNANEMNALAMQGPVREPAMQSGLVHKTLHHWVDKMNTEAQAMTPAANPVMTEVPFTAAPKTQSMQLGREANLQQAAKPAPMNFHIDTIQPDPVQTDSYKVVIRVTPPELGPVHATLKMDKNKVEIKIVTTNSHAEQVIKHHIAALSEQFNKNAMQLDKIDIQQQPQLSLNYGQSEHSGAKYNPEEMQNQAELRTPSPKQATDKSSKNPDALIDAYI